MKIGKKSGLKYFDINDISSWRPGYAPVTNIPKSWRGTAIDILKMENVSYSDRLWVSLRSSLVSEKLMRLFAVWCCRQVQHLLKDPRSVAAVDSAEKFAHGKISSEELASAAQAAYAAYASAHLYIHVVIGSPLAGTAAASSDAAYAAYSSAQVSAHASHSAAYAARCVGHYFGEFVGAELDAGEKVQADKLIEMILEEGKQRIRSKKK